MFKTNSVLQCTMSNIHQIDIQSLPQKYMIVEKVQQVSEYSGSSLSVFLKKRNMINKHH